MQIGNFSELGIFALRFLGLVVTTALVSAASYFLADVNYYLRGDATKRGWVQKAAIICGILAIAGVATVILELAIGNPNKWLGMKLAFYATVWLAAFLISNEAGCGSDLVSGASLVLAIIGAVCFIVFFCVGIFHKNDSTRVENEVVSDVELVAASDAYQVSGRGAGGFLYHSMVISSDGVYRYYYRHENGAIQQGSVDAKDTYIYYTEDGETPHLEKHQSYALVQRHINRQVVAEPTGVTVWYDLYIPEGSILTDFAFDLN